MDGNTLEKIEKKVEEARKIVKKVNEMIETPFYTTIHDITKTLEAIYNALSRYYERLQTKEIPPEIHKEYIKTLRKEIEEKLKTFENKYITLEVVTKDENGKPVTKKIHVNAKLFVDLVTEKFGLVLWEHLAIRTPPPELLIMILHHLEYLYNRMSKLETSIKYITELLVTITDAIGMLEHSTRKFYQLTWELEDKISRLNKALDELTKKIRETSEKIEKTEKT